MRGLNEEAVRRMWAVVRKMPPPIQASDLEQLAEVDGAEAAAFLGLLLDGGYLRERTAGGYVLRRDTGPKPPSGLRIEALADGNTGEVVVVRESPEGAAERLRLGPREEVTQLVVLGLAGKARFDLDYAVAATGLDRRKVLRCLDRLVREQFLKLRENTREPQRFGVSGPPRRNPVYEVARDPAARPTRQNREGDTIRDRLWRAIRRVRRFTLAGLAEASGCSPASAQDFVRLLKRDGFVRADGREGRKSVFVIQNDPGPGRPVTFEQRNRRQ